MRSLQARIPFLLFSLFLVLQLFGCGNQMVGWTVDHVPTVSSTAPSAGATNVVLNTYVAATFSEMMDPATITAASFTVEQGSTPVAGTVFYIGVTALFIPTENFNGNTEYKATITSEAKDLTGNALAADYVWNFTTYGFSDETAPQVTATTPSANETDVAFNAPITATFSEVMNPLTITTSTFTLRDGANPVSGSVMYVGVTAVFTPAANLDGDTSYTATITSGVKDLAGNAMAVDYNWNFQTATDADLTPPMVSSVSPQNSAIDVALNEPVVVTFTEVMDPLTITQNAFTLFDGATPVPVTVMYVGVTAIFVPIDGFIPETAYVATVLNSVEDLAGNAMINDFTWSFTTGELLDITAPQVTATNPISDATDVSVSSNVIGVFSEAMDPLTINTTSFTLFDGVKPVFGSVNYVGVTATFSPFSGLDDNTLYTARISSSAADLAGNQMNADYVWQFTSGMAPDITPPQVIATDPTDGEVLVDFNTTITATFSEMMNPLTINVLTFTLKDGLTPIPSIVTYTGVTAILTPLLDLDPETEYNATITTNAQDLSGNALLADYTWVFTTGPVPDTQAPRVTFVVPADDATGVTIDGHVTVVFSEPMDPLTITTANLVVQQLSGIIVGTVSYTGLTAVFTPASPLSNLTTYTAAVTTATRDLSGNALAHNYVWNFTTGAAPDTTHPLVIFTVPADGDVDVAVDTQVSATFNEVMDPLTINMATFELMDGTVSILGNVSQMGDTATFAPMSNLASNTEYTAVITVGATDLAGNSLEQEYAWSFTTGMLVDIIAPEVIFTEPDDLEINVALDATVNATFSEDMDPLTITTVTFMLTGPGNIEETGTVLYDDLNRIATFTPDLALLPATLYTATILADVTDLAGTPMVLDYVWTFSTADDVWALLPVDLGSLSTFVAVAGSGLTNSNSSGTTTLNGDVGLSPTATCLGDGSPCMATNPVINGTLYANDPAGVAAQAKVDLTAAYVDAMSRPVGTTVNDISGMTLAPGVYTSGSTMSIAVGGTVTLDGMGDANAVWIFQVGSSLTVNNNAQVLLINGAKAKNVFWAVFASSTLGSTVNFQGSVLAGASNSVGTDSVVDGRLLCRVGQITLLSNVITLPAL